MAKVITGTITEHEQWLRLDEKFKTEEASPLHHNNRCQYCKKLGKVDGYHVR